MNGDFEDVRADLPPSASYVVFVLEDSGGSLTRPEIQKRTGLADRTLDEALARLEGQDIVRRDRDADDLRFTHIEIEDPNRDLKE